MEEKQIAPLTDEQASAFVEKLTAFRETLAPHEQAALDVMVLRTAGMTPEGEVSGYDDGGAGNQPNIYGDDYVAPTWRYAGPTYVTYVPAPVGYTYYVPVVQPFYNPGFFYSQYGGVIRRW